MWHNNEWVYSLVDSVGVITDRINSTDYLKKIRKRKKRLDEIENPELAQARMNEIYEKKGCPKDWIDKRLRGIAIRQNLTDEWKERGIKEQRYFVILTAGKSKVTFGITPGQSV